MARKASVCEVARYSSSFCKRLAGGVLSFSWAEFFCAQTSCKLVKSRILQSIFLPTQTCAKSEGEV